MKKRYHSTSEHLPNMNSVHSMCTGSAQDAKTLFKITKRLQETTEHRQTTSRLQHPGKTGWHDHSKWSQRRLSRILPNCAYLLSRWTIGSHLDSIERNAYFLYTQQEYRDALTRIPFSRQSNPYEDTSASNFFIHSSAAIPTYAA